MRLALAQINTVVGDLDGNRDLILSRLQEAREQGADLALFPELAVTGYPPEDLLLRSGFVRAAAQTLGEIAAQSRDIVALVGFPFFDTDLYNACAVCAGGEVMFVTRARDNTCFVAFCNAVGGQDELIFDGHSCVLDDEGEVVSRAVGFEETLLVTDVEPKGVIGRRLRDVRRRALARERDVTPPVQVVHAGDVRVVPEGSRAERSIVAFEPELEQMRLALELGLRDYVQKNGFADVVIGVSGGIDSAVTGALAVEALGSERVHCVSMPSRYSSEATQTDARRLAESLGCDFREISIEPMFEAYVGALREHFAGTETDLTEENLQARIRGTLLMALSNKFGWLVVATGNKSELSVGYSTLYGDMAGGFALIKDVFKTDVFRLARHLNERGGRELIPRSIIERAPSAELRADQLDEDSLPPYSLLDQVLEAYVELDRSREELSSDGFDPDLVERAVAMIDRAEYKRRQAPPGVRLRPKAFGRDRRTPITNRWRG